MGTLFPKKEWWIDSVISEKSKPIWRGSIGGSNLADHRARQIRRSLEEADVRIVDLVQVLGENKTIVAFHEHATVEQIPEKAQGIEWRNNLRIGQPLNSWLARWQLVCETAEDIERALEMGAQTFLLNPKLREEDEENWEPHFPAQFGTEAAAPYTSESLCSTVHRLLGERTHPRDRARYLGDAIWDIVEDCEILLLVHADKHGECLGVYAKEELDLQELLVSLAKKKEIVLVPFSIPVMNGRWNRSIRDFLRRWDSEDGEFPIPIFEHKEVEVEQELESVDSEADDSEDGESEE